ncbi:MAG: proline dehydrogenase family protein, partial [Pollutimonas bauzanensis]
VKGAYWDSEIKRAQERGLAGYPVFTRKANTDVSYLACAQALLADMLASRDHWLPLLAPGSDVDQLLDNLDRAVQSDLERLSQAMPPGWAGALAPMVSRAASVLAGKGAPEDWCILEDWRGEAFDSDISCLAQWQALADVLLTKENKLRRTVNIRQGFEAKADYKDDFLAWIKAVPEAEPWVAALADIRSAPRGGYSGEQQETLRVLIEVLWLAAAQLNVCFTEAAEVDFTEISRRALDALGQVDDPSDLLLALDTVIRHILVDEFQDTSQSQIQLLERLTSGWMAGDGRTLFLVGDPMQSIYRFRKAEVGLFLTVKERGLGEVALTPLELKDNFRSQAQLVDWVNKTCRPIFPKEDHPGLGAIRYTDSVAFNDAVEGLGVEFHPVWTLKGAQDPESGDPAATAESIAIQLAKEALARHPDSEHPVAILVRARSHLDSIVHRLAQQNIPCRAVELVSLKSRQVVIDLAQLARALSHPADRLAWLSVLRSPLCGLTLASLHALCGADLRAAVPALLAKWLAQGGGAGLDEMEAKRMRHAAAVLLDASNASGAIPFAAWLESCWQRLGGPAVYSSQSDAADAERLLRLVEELAPYGNLDPAALDERLEKLYAAPEGSGRAVEVMTIHKSKGLEFDTVILAGLHRRPKGDTPPLLRFEHSGGELLLGPIKHKVSDEHDPVSVYLAGRDKKRAAYEADRLLYVALTRARQQLHLIGAVTLEDGPAMKRPEPASLLGRLWDYMQAPEIPELAELGGDGAAPDAPRPQRLLVRMAAQSLPAAAAPQIVPPQAGGWAWRPDSGHESMVGTVAHAWLERIGKEGIDAWSVERVDGSLPIFRKQLSRAGLVGAAVDAATQVLRDTLAATLASPKGRWLLWAARAHREWSLLDVSGRVSVIDLAISQEQDWLVVDYKTGVPQGGETRDAFAGRMRERYREQIERYCAHVSALDGRPARGALYFPRADVWVDY